MSNFDPKSILLASEELAEILTGDVEFGEYGEAVARAQLLKAADELEGWVISSEEGTPGWPDFRSVMKWLREAAEAGNPSVSTSEGA